jgi:hypothetical protein
MIMSETKEIAYPKFKVCSRRGYYLDFLCRGRVVHSLRSGTSKRYASNKDIMDNSPRLGNKLPESN